jgi:hypothetical protein
MGSVIARRAWRLRLSGQKATAIHAAAIHAAGRPSSVRPTRYVPATTSKPQTALVTEGEQRTAHEGKGQGDQVAVGRLVPVSQCKIDRQIPREDPLRFGAKGGLIVRHPGGNSIELVETQKTGYNKEDDERSDL